MGKEYERHTERGTGTTAQYVMCNIIGFQLIGNPSVHLVTIQNIKYQTTGTCNCSCLCLNWYSKQEFPNYT